MDIFSHGLWGGIAFGRKNRRSFWASFLFGIFPDFFAFAPFFVTAMLGLGGQRLRFGEPPSEHIMPDYIYSLYGISHSLVIFAAVFIAALILFRRPVYEMLAWPLHILVDIPTHSEKFFPTPFLWPISDIHISGHPWSDPVIFVPNIMLLAGLYIWYFIIKPRRFEARQKALRKQSK